MTRIFVINLLDGNCVESDDLCVGAGQQDWRMGGDDKLGMPLQTRLLQQTLEEYDFKTEDVRLILADIKSRQPYIVTKS